jgi:hypothetical protein
LVYLCVGLVEIVSLPVGRSAMPEISAPGSLANTRRVYEYSGVIWTRVLMSFVAFGLVTQLSLDMAI